MHKIQFRGKRKDNNEWVTGYLFEEEPPLQCFASENDEPSKWVILKSGFADWNMTRPTTGAEVYYESIGQLTGFKDSKGVDVYTGDIIEFWVCYPTSQTHTGDNIPNGSYTEPDETQLLKIKGEVIYDEEQCEYTFSIIGKTPYQFGYAFNGLFPDENMPIISREYYTKDYIQCCFGINQYENQTDSDVKDYEDAIKELTGLTEDGLCKVINDVTVVGNVYDNKDSQ